MALRDWKEESRGTFVVIRAIINEFVVYLFTNHVLLICLTNHVNLPSQEMPPYSSPTYWNMDEAQENPGITDIDVEFK